MVTMQYVSKLGLRPWDAIEITVNIDARPAVTTLGYFQGVKGDDLVYLPNSTEFPEFRTYLGRIRKIKKLVPEKQEK